MIAEGNLTLNTSGLSNGNVYKWNLVSSEAVTSSNTLTINGNGTPTFGGDINYTGNIVVSSPTGVAINFTGDIQAGSFKVAHYYGDLYMVGNTVNVGSLFAGAGGAYDNNLMGTISLEDGNVTNAEQVRLAELGHGVLNVKQGAVLNVTGNNNQHATAASFLLGHRAYSPGMVQAISRLLPVLPICLEWISGLVGIVISRAALHWGLQLPEVLVSTFPPPSPMWLVLPTSNWGKERWARSATGT